MSDLGIDEMVSDSGDDRQKPVIGNSGDSLRLLMVVPDEPQMGNERPKVMPARERLDVDQKALERSFLFNVGINFKSQFLKIARLQRRLRRHDQNALVAQQLVGIRRSPEQIVAAAIREHVDAIGLSLLSGAHRTLFKRVIDLLKEKNAEEVMVLGGGPIHPNDIMYLQEIGVKAIFTPGASAETILAAIHRLFLESECATVGRTGAKRLDHVPGQARLQSSSEAEVSR